MTIKIKIIAIEGYKKGCKMSNAITIYSKKHRDFLKTNYKVGGDGVAFDTVLAMRNYFYFFNINITKIMQSNRSKRIITDKEIYKSCNKELFLSGSLKSCFDDVLVLQNGNYVLQQYDKESDNTYSLFSGYHKKQNLVIDYFYAMNLLNSINFDKVNKNTDASSNKEIVIIDFIKCDNETMKSKWILKKKVITIDKDLSIEEKKEFIIKYDENYKNSVVMQNNNIFYILKAK